MAMVSIRISQLSHIEVSMSNLVTHLNQTPTFEWYASIVIPRTNTKKTCVQKSLDWVFKIC